MKFSIKEFFSTCDQIRWRLWIWSHLLKKSLMENFIFCVVLAKQIGIYDLSNWITFLNFKTSLVIALPLPTRERHLRLVEKKSIKFRWMKSLAENLIEFFSFFNKAKHMNQTSQINKIIATRNGTTSPNDEPKFFYFLWLCIESVE